MNRSGTIGGSLWADSPAAGVHQEQHAVRQRSLLQPGSYIQAGPYQPWRDGAHCTSRAHILLYL
jgi:hypothetical protein